MRHTEAEGIKRLPPCFRAARGRYALYADTRSPFRWETTNFPKPFWDVDQSLKSSLRTPPAATADSTKAVDISFTYLGSKRVRTSQL